jgi:hypothetical protein
MIESPPFNKNDFVIPRNVPVKCVPPGNEEISEKKRFKVEYLWPEETKGHLKWLFNISGVNRAWSSDQFERAEKT